MDKYSNKPIMKTLIIHPNDTSTDFLKPIYMEIPNKKVITEVISREELLYEIENYDNVLIMGHGGNSGLFGLRLMDDNIVDRSFLNVLKLKHSLVFIWCNADKFVIQNDFEHQNLLYTGMFISEPLEIIFLDEEIQNSQIMDYDPMIEVSNFAFSKILGTLFKENGFQNLKHVYSELKRQYFEVAKNNEVAAYNCQRIYK